jgi:RimJ/RimL family protein N-acetyltransferase
VIREALRDGAPVQVRPIRPEDKPLLAAGFTRLSPESRAWRFGGPITELTDEQLRSLTEVDFVDRFAWVALLEADPSYAAGVGRYVRVAGEPEVAEAAITVVDACQGLGLATILIAPLGVAAAGAGIRRFRAFVAEGNASMRGLLERLGATSAFESPGVLRMEIDVDAARMPDTPAAETVRRIAAGMLG